MAAVRLGSFRFVFAGDDADFERVQPDPAGRRRLRARRHAAARLQGVKADRRLMQNADQQNPLICIESSGICREQCREDRDCGVGQQCRQTPVRQPWASPGLTMGVCQLIQAETIRPVQACVANRDCTKRACAEEICRP